MSPEQRADAVIDAIMDEIMSLIRINGEPITSVDVLNPAPALIATAIREAEDAAYERAATLIETDHIDADEQPGYGHWEWGANEAGRNIAAAIRNLKSQEP